MRAALIQATAMLKQAQRVLFDFEMRTILSIFVSGDSPSPKHPVVGDDISSILRKIKADNRRTSSVLWNKLDLYVLCVVRW